MLDVGRSGCGDERDNDADHLFDTEDPQCDSLTDANERLDGAQPYVATELPMEVAADGTITVDPTEFITQQQEFCFDAGGLACMGLTIVGTGPVQTGSVTPTGVSLPWSVTIEMDAIVVYAGLASGCSAGPISGSLVGNSYDEVTGETTVSLEGASVPAVTNCGSEWNPLINSFLQLPAASDATLVATILNGDDEPIVID